MTMLKADGFDDAVIGLAELWVGNARPNLIAYDYDKCVEILAKDMTHEEAVEYMDFNVTGAYMGEGTPIFIHPMSLEEIEEGIEEGE